MTITIDSAGTATPSPALCMCEGMITGCPDGTIATRLVRAAITGKRSHPLCDACTLSLATDLDEAVVITAIGQEAS